MVDAELVEERRVEVGHTDRVDRGLVTELIGGAVDVPLFEAAARELVKA